jgi:hypothetical protein
LQILCATESRNAGHTTCGSFCVRLAMVSTGSYNSDTMDDSTVCLCGTLLVQADVD